MREPLILISILLGVMFLGVCACAPHHHTGDDDVSVDDDNNDNDDATTDDDDNDDDDDDDDNDDATPTVGYDVGDTMPYFSLMSNSGQPVSLADTDIKGKVILLDSSAMWCSNCRSDSPTLETDYYEKCKNTGPGFVVLQLLGENDATPPQPPTLADLQRWASNDTNQQDQHYWTPLVQLTFPVLADVNGHQTFYVGNKIGDNQIPLYWVLDTNLVIRAKSDNSTYLELSDFDAIIEQLVDCTPGPGD